MNWHAQTNRPNAPRTAADSMAVAFANLLLKFDVRTEPETILESLDNGTEPLDWATITAVEPRLMPTTIGDYGTWPTNTTSIVRFSYVNTDGEELDHYCVIANPENHTIIDSYDGRTQYTGSYGEPTGWASYALIELDEDGDDILEEPSTAPVIKERTGVPHNVVTGENIWRLAQRYQLTVEDIMAHNELTDHAAVTPGALIYLPLSGAQKAHRPISYEILPAPRPMHVSHPGGAKKWSFGHVRTWKDIKDNGQLFPQNHNLSIVAIAHVPVEDTVAAYYMDDNSFGDYRHTGLVRYTLGFNWQHLADGHVFPDFTPEPILDDETVEKIEEALKTQSEPVAALETPTEPEPTEPDFKATYQGDAEPVKYLARNSMLIYDFDGKQPARPLRANQPVIVVGSFIKDGVTYGLPTGAAKHGSWYGVPMTNLYIEEELYNTNVSLSDKVALKKNLSLDEKVTIVLGRNIAKIERIRTILARKK